MTVHGDRIISDANRESFVQSFVLEPQGDDAGRYFVRNDVRISLTADVPSQAPVHGKKDKGKDAASAATATTTATATATATTAASSASANGLRNESKKPVKKDAPSEAGALEKKQGNASAANLPNPNPTPNPATVTPASNASHTAAQAPPKTHKTTRKEPPTATATASAAPKPPARPSSWATIASQHAPVAEVDGNGLSGTAPVGQVVSAAVEVTEPEVRLRRERPNGKGDANTNGNGNGNGNGQKGSGNASQVGKGGRGGGNTSFVAYVGNLPADANETEIKELFSAFGKIVRLERKKNSAYVSYALEGACQNAMEAANSLAGLKMQDRRLTVEEPRSAPNTNSNPNYSRGAGRSRFQRERKAGKVGTQD